MDAPPWSAPEQKIGAPAQPKSAPEKPASAPEPPKSAAGKAGPSTSPATTSPATTAPVNHAACSPQALNAKDRGKPPAEPDASLHSLYAETTAGHVEGDDSTETAVLTLTKKEEVAESSSSRRRPRDTLSPVADTCVRQPTGCASGHGVTNTLPCSSCGTLMTSSWPRS